MFPERPRDNRFNPRGLRPKGRAYVIREQHGERGCMAPWRYSDVVVKTINAEFCLLAK